MTIDEAKRIVLEKIPGARISRVPDGDHWGANGDYQIVVGPKGLGRRLGNITITQSSAWLSAARRLKEGEKK